MLNDDQVVVGEQAGDHLRWKRGMAEGVSTEGRAKQIDQKHKCQIRAFGINTAKAGVVGNCACGSAPSAPSVHYRVLMSSCTAPVQGHRTASGAANCPACRGRRSGYSSRPYSPQPDYASWSSIGGSASSRGGSGNGRTRAPWSPSTSAVTYTSAEVRALTPIRRTVELRARQEPDLRDIFLCHAWDDRNGPVKELYDLLHAAGVSVWFSQKDLMLAVPFMREIDRGLAKSRTGLVFVTPALLKRVASGGVSDKELSELLARDLLLPVVHETTFEELRKVSPLLASRNGLDTAEDSMADIAKKIAELVSIEDALNASLTSTT